MPLSDLYVDQYDTHVTSNNNAYCLAISVSNECVKVILRPDSNPYLRWQCIWEPEYVLTQERHDLSIKNNDTIY